MRKLNRNLVFVIIAAILMLAGGCNFISSPFRQATEYQQPSTSVPAQTEPPVSVDLLAVGDNLIHEPIYNEAREITGNNGYDFGPEYSRVEGMIKNADISFLNQETPLAGASLGISAYPQFNSPQELGDHMAEMGFDVINHANNHILDKRETGLINTLNFWKKYPDITVIGAYESRQDSEKIQIVERKGIKFSFIGFTYGTNGIFLKDGSNAVINYTTDESLKEHISEARKVSDVVVVSMHWGNEGQMVPSDEQKRLAGLIASVGADVIIGSHPHVIQPIEYIDRPDGGRTLVVYSLGNFISTQKEARNMLGGMVDIKFEKSNSGSGISLVKISDVKFTPLITHYNSKFRDIGIYPFSEYTRELAAEHGCIKYDSKFSYDYLQALINKTISTEYLK